MAIEITPKQKISSLPLIIIGAFICLSLALLLLISYFYFDFRIKKTSQELEEKTKQILPLEQAVKKEEQEIILTKNKIDDFSSLLSSHKKILNFFSFLERVSLPNVWFFDFNLNSREKTIFLSGQTDDFLSLEHQIAALKQEPLLEKVRTSEVLINDEGKVNFTFSLTFNSEIFRSLAP